MRLSRHMLKDCLFMILTLVLVFFINLFLVEQFETKTMTPMVFVLGVFLVSWRTQGYVWGIAASLISVLAVNWAFTYPYWAFDLISPECISAAVVMLIVAAATGTLTTRLKRQEQLKAEAEKERMRGNLLRAVSHDLRTPLTSIYGACSAMIENYDDISRERHLKMLGDVRSDAQWLNRMVENLLSVTRVDAQSVRLAKQSTVLEELIDALLVKFRKHYPGQNVQAAAPSSSFVVDDLIIDYDRRKVSVDGKQIHLPQTEFNILAYLSHNTGKVMTYSAIIRAVWGSMDDGSIKKLQVNMASIRKKLGCRPGDNRYVTNELGVGYRMLDE